MRYNQKMLDTIFSFFNTLTTFIVGFVFITLTSFGVIDNPTPSLEHTSQGDVETVPLIELEDSSIENTYPEERKENVPAVIPNTALSPTKEKPATSPSELPSQEVVSAPEDHIPTEADLNRETRSALVNIFCTTKEGNVLSSITGSGVLIDPRGIILTNTHIAQFFLLEDYKHEGYISCLIRTGAPAKPAFKAEPIYISLPWIEKNAYTLVEESPKGTGEDDFALLRITEPVGSGTTLPNAFAYITPDMNEDMLTTGTPVLLAAYPAGFLDGTIVQKNLWPASAVSIIKEIFTFATDTIDLLSTGGSVVAQKGSSGGGVVSMITGKLIGIVVTSSEEDSTGDRDLRAITLSHVNRSMSGDIGMDMNAFLAGDPTERQKDFQETRADTIRQILFSVLNR
ncbi:MAG: serine protease [Patescibacteria group bacterium]|nr:serine protease [Patescibacteria group bacterium]